PRLSRFSCVPFSPSACPLHRHSFPTRRSSDLYADRNVLDASFIKLRDVTLAYAIPAKLCQRVRTESIDLRLQVGNIMVWKANDYAIDPEFHDAFVGSRGLLAHQQTFTIGMHVNF